MHSTWQMIKVVISNPRTKKSKKSIFDNPIECTHDNPIAEVFGIYYSEVTDNVKAEIHQTSFDPLSLIPIKA